MEEKLLGIHQVRERPVGLYSRNGWLSLQAEARGYFPISQTGYRSLSGMAPDKVTPELLEGLAMQQQRERDSLIREVKAGPGFEPHPLTNYICASSIAMRALESGFFALSADRRELWQGANRIFQQILDDSRYQPVLNGRWTEEACARNLEKTRTAREYLQRCARGESLLPTPGELFGARAYFALPQLAPEPVIDLGREQLSLFAPEEVRALRIRC